MGNFSLIRIASEIHLFKLPKVFLSKKNQQLLMLNIYAMHPFFPMLQTPQFIPAHSQHVHGYTNCSPPQKSYRQHNQSKQKNSGDIQPSSQWKLAWGPELKEPTITLLPPHKDRSSTESAKTPEFKIRPSKTEEEQLLILSLCSDPTNSAIRGWVSGLGVKSSRLMSPCSDSSRFTIF